MTGFFVAKNADFLLLVALINDSAHSFGSIGKRENSTTRVDSRGDSRRIEDGCRTRD